MSDTTLGIVIGSGMASSIVRDFANANFNREPMSIDRIAVFDRGLAAIQDEVRKELQCS